MIDPTVQTILTQISTELTQVPTELAALQATAAQPLQTDPAFVAALQGIATQVTALVPATPTTPPAAS